MSAKKKYYIIAYNINDEGVELKKEIIGPFETYPEVKECVESKLLDNDEVTHAEVVTVNKKFAFRSIRKVFEDEI